MTNVLQSIRALAGLFLLIACIQLSFKGFPFALISLLGSAIVLMGYQVAISTISHSDSPTGPNPWRRFWTICVAFAVASLGAAAIQWGGLASINLGSALIDLKWAGVIAGATGGLFNIDKELIK
jgi:hypothetical protein